MIPYRFPSAEMFFGYCVGVAEEVCDPRGEGDDVAHISQAIAIGAMGSYWTMDDFGVQGAVAFGVGIMKRHLEEDHDDEG